MLEFFSMGGPLFMGILTLLLLIILALTIYRAVQITRGDILPETTFRNQLKQIRSLGLFAMVLGIFGQLIGLYDAFSVIEQAGDISPSLLAGGLKVSMISTLYGIFIFLFSWLAWMTLDYRVKSRETTREAV